MLERLWLQVVLVLEFLRWDGAEDEDEKEKATVHWRGFGF